MRQLLATDTRAASNTLVTVLLAGVVAISATAAGAIVTTQYQEDISNDTDITDAQIETPTRDQVHISSLVGDDLPLESTKVRIEFLDRNAPPAVVTDLSEGVSASNAVTISETTEVSQPKLEPVTRNVTVKVPNGTVNKTEVPAHKWEKGGKSLVTKTTSHSGDSDAEVHYVFIEYKPASFRYSGASWDPDGLMLIKGANGENHATWEGDWSGVPSRFAACEAAAPDGALFSGGSWKNGLGSNDYSERYPEPRDSTYPVKPGESLNYDYTKKYPACDDLVQDLKNNQYPHASQYDGTLMVGPTQVKSPKAKETVDTTKTVVSHTKPKGDGWTKVESNVSTVTVELDKPKTTYKTETREVTVGHKKVTSTTEVTRDRKVYTPASVPNDVEVDAKDTYTLFSGKADADDDSDTTAATTTTLPADAALTNANDSAAFLANGQPNSAAGVGGTIGTTESGMMMQGDELIIQLDRPLLYNDERISVEIIDTETNTVVLDQNARVDDLQSITKAADTTNVSTVGGSGSGPSDGGSGNIGDPSFNGTVPINVSGPDDVSGGGGDTPPIVPPSDSGDGPDDGDNSDSGDYSDGGGDDSVGGTGNIDCSGNTIEINGECEPTIIDIGGDGPNGGSGDNETDDGDDNPTIIDDDDNSSDNILSRSVEKVDIEPCGAATIALFTICGGKSSMIQGGEFIDGVLGTDMIDGEEMVASSGLTRTSRIYPGLEKKTDLTPGMGPSKAVIMGQASPDDAREAGEAVRNTAGSVGTSFSNAAGSVTNSVSSLLNGGSSGTAGSSSASESSGSESSNGDSGSSASSSSSPCGTCGGSPGGSSGSIAGLSSNYDDSGSSDSGSSDSDSSYSSGSSSSGSSDSSPCGTCGGSLGGSSGSIAGLSSNYDDSGSSDSGSSYSSGSSSSSSSSDSNTGSSSGYDSSDDSGSSSSSNNSGGHIADSFPI